MVYRLSDVEVSSDQKYYDQENIGSRVVHEKWMKEIEFYFTSYAAKLNSSLLGTSGKVVELGAGSCGLSACLTRLPNVTHVYAIDISLTRMERMINLSFEILGGDKIKIEPVSSDFNARLPFDDESLDAVLFDAALHHSRNMWNLLAECNRILKKGGTLIAQRESYLSAMRAKKQLACLLQTPEVSSNVSENMYLKEQYEYYLAVNGFNVEFIRRTQNKLKRILTPLNGFLFCDGIMFCSKK